MRVPSTCSLAILGLIGLSMLAACAAPIEAAPPAPASPTPITIALTPTPPRKIVTGLRFIEFYSPL